MARLFNGTSDICATTGSPARLASRNAAKESRIPISVNDACVFMYSLGASLILVNALRK